MSTAQIYAALGLPKDVRGDEDHRETCRTLDEALNPPDEFEVTE